MSTILDSLKKSSDQRGDNDKGSIDNFTFSNNKKPRNNSLTIAVLVIFLITAAIMYFGYDYLYSKDDDTQLVVEKVEKVKKTEQTKQLQPEIASKEETKQPAENKKAKPSSTAVKERIKEIKQRKRKEQQALAAQQHDKKQDKNKKPQDRTINPQIKALETLAATNQKQNKEKQEIIKLSNPQEPKKPTKSTTTPINKVTQQPKPKRPPVPTQNYKYLYQLPFAIRKDIPKLTLNIHIYDENPENRLVVINGVRFMVDDMIDEQVLVKDIVREGVVLDFNNHEFLIPKL